MENNRKFLDAMEADIMNADIPESEKSRLIKNFLHLKEQKVNLMVTGATGSGKSSTINALFDMEVAKVGVGVDPETMEITKYELDNLVLWDSPGLGDGAEADKRHAKNIIQKLTERDKSVFECAAAGADQGERVGSIFGRTGETIGRVVGSVAGGVVGGIIGAAKSIFKNW